MWPFHFAKSKSSRHFQNGGKTNFHKTYSTVKKKPKKEMDVFVTKKPTQENEKKRKFEDLQSTSLPYVTPSSKQTITRDQTNPFEAKKQEALQRLAASQRTHVLNAFISNLSEEWKLLFAPEFEKIYFKQLLEFIVNEQKTAKVFPPSSQVFEAFKHCALKDIKVVILGQDPYHQAGQAHGLAFSVARGVTPPPSLKNIFKELSDEFGSEFRQPNHGCLTRWCEQGVLLLNTSLTVKASAPASHSNKGWETFTNFVIQQISSKCEGVVFLLWGNHAQKKTSLIDCKKHHVLTAAHPSPYSADKGFFGCGHFKKANERMIEQGRKPIDWNLG